MRSLLLDGSERAISHALIARCPSLPPLPAVKRELLDYQMHALYYLAEQYNLAGARLLEIGTGRGGSGYMLAKAAPQAGIISLTVDPNGAAQADSLWALHRLKNIDAQVAASWDYLAERPDSQWDLIFVDGDHNQIRRDLPWFDRLTVGGLMVFHDYSPQDSPRPSAICYATLNVFAEYLGRPFDVRIVDDQKTGMVGFYRREGESYGTR